MTNYILYSTEGCHLCEQAAELIADTAPELKDTLQVKDIAYDDALYERYQWSIPVLHAPSGQELNWPFDAQQLKRFID